MLYVIIVFVSPAEVILLFRLSPEPLFNVHGHMWLFACTENEPKLICVKKNMIDMTESFTKEDAKTSAYIFHGHMCFYPEFKREKDCTFGIVCATHSST